MLERLGFLINQTFPRFPPACFTRIKARETFMYKKNRADPSHYNIVFPFILEPHERLRDIGIILAHIR